MDHLVDTRFLTSLAENAERWLFDSVLVFGNLGQLVAIAAAFLIARLAAARAQTLIEAAGRRAKVGPRMSTALATAARFSMPVVWLALCWIGVTSALNAGWPHELLKITASLLTAWIAIRVASNLVRDAVWSRVIAVSAWAVAALNILDLLGPTVRILDSLALRLGDIRISALAVIKGVIALAVLIWLATLVSRLLEQRIRGLPNLTPSMQVLFSKLVKIVLTLIAIVVALGSVGIDLTAFAVFSGAVGVGIGFGLQKVVSNLVSGVILLLDKSIKPGDVIAVGNSYGWINSLGARYVSVITRDGVEHLIPNEDLITQRVENWSFSNNLVRLRIPIGISYSSDVRQATEFCLRATEDVERVLKEPRAICLVKGFGESSVDLELRFWIRDPQNGTANVRSAVLLRLWDLFHEHGIEIPFPQRDIRLSASAPIPVAVHRSPADAPRD